MYDIIIIGSGIAGLTSAIYSLRANKKVLILEKKCYGGQIIKSTNVENYPGFSNISGYDLMTNIYNKVKDLGGEIKYEEVIEITKDKTVKTYKNNYSTKSIIIATGVCEKRLNLDNEKKLIGRGISYCATCDGNFYRNKNVAVVGGGNSALEDVLYLSDICAKVYLIHRKDEFRGDNKYIKALKQKDNITIIYNSIITKINGENNLTSIDVNNNSTKEENNLLVDGLFIDIGRAPDNQIFDPLIELNELGYINSDDCNTNVEGIFVAGDARTKELRQLITAASDGAIAATKAIKYVGRI